MIMTSNGVPVPFDSRYFAPLRESSETMEDHELRTRYEEDGYVLLRSVLDAEEVKRMRGEYFAAFNPSYLAPGTTPEDGLFSGTVPSDLPKHGFSGHPAHSFVRSDSYIQFVSDDRLANLAEAVLGGSVKSIPRRIVRHFHRGTQSASRVHTDATYIHGESERMVTMWLSIGDCPIWAGGLVYLENSHRLSDEDLDLVRGVTDRPDDPRPITHDLKWAADQLNRRWLWTNIRAGDVILHSPTMVHASVDCTVNMMRLSTDLRFVCRDEGIDSRWSRPWSGDDGF